jgi:hypothetical protein
MSSLTSVLNQLEHERTRLASQLENLTNALSALNGTSKNGTRKGTMSAAGRARIAAAQRARWAKAKGQKVVSITARKGYLLDWRILGGQTLGRQSRSYENTSGGRQ